MKQQILVIHGGNVFATYDEFLKDLKAKKLNPQKLRSYGWKSMLAENLGEEFDVLTPKMPNEQNSKYVEWKIWFDKLIPYLEDNLILLGHSLGGIFLTKYLSENILPKKIRALILVATPFNTPKIHPLGDFLITEPSDKISEQVKIIFLYQSEDDKIVPFPNSSHYKEYLPKIELNIFKDRGHFSDEEFPEIVEKIKSLS